MDDQPTAPAPSTSRLVDVQTLTDVLASSSKVPLEQLIKPSSQSYLSNLTTYGLQELTAEPTILQTQSHHLTSSLTSLTHTSYPTFLSLHKTTKALTTSLTSLSSSLDALLNSSLPALEESAAGWKDRTESVLKERSKAKVVLEQHEKIRDLLEIPLLIDTCVRNGYFAEALSLVAHAKALAANASTSNKPTPLILSSVLSEVHHSIMQMLLSLLTTLYEPNRKLPALWKAVNFLRKMDVFGPSSPFASAPTHLKGAQTETDSKHIEHFADFISSEEQIALAFLVGRESCLKSTLEPSGSDISRMTNHGELDDREKEDLARYLKKYIDLWREGVYDITTQYSTIFLEKSSSSSILQPSTAKPTSPTTPTPNSEPSNHDQEWIQLHALITTYTSRALTAHLLPVLSPSLHLLSLSLLPSLLTQLTYCSTAFARVGLDFRAILSVLFSDAVAEVISKEFKAAGATFESRFKVPSAPGQSQSSREINGASSRKSKWKQPSKWLVTSGNAALPPVPVTPATPASPSFAQSPPHIPPQILASYPPLAEHTNTILGVLNGLRLLAPTSILPTLARVLDDEVLAKGGQALQAYIKAFLKDWQSMSSVRSDEDDSEVDKEKTIIMAFGQVYFGILVPFIRRALVEGVYAVQLDSTFEGGGENLPNVVMDWEDFVLEVEDDSGKSEDDS